MSLRFSSKRRGTINQLDKINIDKFFTFAQNTGTRGHSRKLYKKRSRLNVRANAFSNRVVDVWNSLTASVVTAPTLNAFKSRLNKYWRGHQLKFNPSCYTPGKPQYRVEKTIKKWVDRSNIWLGRTATTVR